MQDTLTHRQERFAVEYIVDLNAAAAARRCGYARDNAAAQGAAMMKIPAVRDCIRRELTALLAQLQVSMLDLVRERKKAAFFSNAGLFGADGKLLTIETMDADTRRAMVLSVEWRQGEPILRLRSPNREAALRALERYHERLDKQDQAYYDRLEAQGGQSPVAEPEGEPVPESDGDKKHGGLSGTPANPLDNHRGLSGAPQPVRAEPVEARAKPAGARPSTGSGQTEIGRETSEKHGVLSGVPAHSSEKHAVLPGADQPSLEGLGPAVRAWLEKTRVLSGFGEGGRH